MQAKLSQLVQSMAGVSGENIIPSGRFRDRRQAGRLLARILSHLEERSPIVLALPRGGVVVGYEISRILGLPLDVIITRKIGAPDNPEYAIGAVAENGEVLLNRDEIDALGASQNYIDAEIRHQQQEIARRVDLYRGGRGLTVLRDRIAVIVDDGVATGFTTATAIEAVRSEHPQKIHLAVPTAPRDTLAWLAGLADEVVCLDTPEPFLAVGRFYVNFSQVTDEEVRRYLEEAGGRERTLGA